MVTAQGGDPAVSVFPRTRAATGHAALHGPPGPARTRAAVVLARLDACDYLLAVGNGHAPAAVHGALRDLVLAVRDLASPAWLQASADDPDVAAFTALQATASPPRPAQIDQ